MLTFSQYLEESSRSYPLYHGIATDEDTLPVLKEMQLRPLTRHMGRQLLLNKNKTYHGISTTRNLDFAKKWALSDSSYGVVLELNQKAIEHNYKIVPINYFSGSVTRYHDGLGKRTHYTNTGIGVSLKDLENEYEEFIVTNKPIPLNDRYLVAIHVNKSKYMQGGSSKGIFPLLEKLKDKLKFY